MRFPVRLGVASTLPWTRAARMTRPRPRVRRPERWARWWLELSTAAGIAVVLIICLTHAWSGPLLLDPLLAVPPALAGIGATTARRPLAYGAACLVAAAIVAITATSGTLPDAVIVAVALVTAVSAAGTMLAQGTLARDTERHLASVSSVAEAAQRAVLRPVPEKVGPLGLGVVYLAAAADARVGGDLYEVASTPHGIRLIIGDVRGKGLGAVEVAADVLGTYRETAHQVHTLPELARRLDAGLSRRWGQHEEFVTALLAEIDPDGGRVSLFSCGHPPAMLMSADGVEVLEVPAPAPPLGLLTLGDSSGAGRTIVLKPDSQLLLYTDGVTEARDARREFYPLRERLAVLGRRADADLLQLLRADLLRHVGAPLADDAAMLLVRAPATWPVPVRGTPRPVIA